MIQLTIMVAGGLLLASHFGILPHSPAIFAIGAALAALAVIWVGLFART